MTSVTLARGAAFSGVILLSGCLLLSGCSNAGSAGSASVSSGGKAASPHGAAANPGPAVAGPAVAANAGLALVGGSGTALPAAALSPASQSVIYTASVTLRSASAMATAKRAVAIVTGAGGYTADEHAVAGSRGQPGGEVTLTLKVPVPVYQAVLAQLSAPSLGKQIALRQQATDVTQEVANVNSLVTSQQDAIDALQGLLRHAANVSQLLQVQQQISADESQLESLQAQQRALDHETSYATVAMTLETTAHPAVRKHAASHNFLTGLTAGWRALRHAVASLLTALGAALPFLIVAAILAAAGYAGRRRFLRGRTGPTAAG
jgi:hypothetical protein